MPPIKEFMCMECGFEYEDIVKIDEPHPSCPHCESQNVEKLVSSHGGYSMSSGGSSTRPRGAGAFRKAKA